MNSILGSDMTNVDIKYKHQYPLPFLLLGIELDVNKIKITLIKKSSKNVWLLTIFVLCIPTSSLDLFFLT